MKEIQELGVVPETVYEKTRITVDKIDDKDYLLIFRNPKNLAQMYPSTKIPGKATETEFKEAIKGYYENVLKTDIFVKRTMKNAAGDVVADILEATKLEYEITLKKLISGTSTNSIKFMPQESKAEVTVEYAETVGKSSPPLSGKYKVKCVDKDGKVSMTGDIPFDSNSLYVSERIMKECTGLLEKLEPLDPVDVPADGVKVRFRFKGLSEDPGQFEMVSSTVAPLQGNNLKFESKTIYPYGTNLFYNPVPFEFLKTFEEKPQMIVNVGDQPAVCHNMTCDFTYIETKGLVTDWKFDEASKKMVISGNQLPLLAVKSVDTCSPITVEADCTADTSCTWANDACSKVVIDTCTTMKTKSLCAVVSTCFWKTTC